MAKVCIGLMNPKNATNVGAVMRAAGCFSVDSVFYTGTRYDRSKNFHTDTKNRVDTIPLKHVESLLADIGSHIRRVGIEFVEGAESLPSYKHPLDAYYLFGPEDGSLTQSQIDACDDVVYVPTTGCMNLAASVNVVLYDRMAKLYHDQEIDHDVLIRDNRDCRNRLKVRHD